MTEAPTCEGCSEPILPVEPAVVVAAPADGDAEPRRSLFHGRHAPRWAHKLWDGVMEDLPGDLADELLGL